MFRASSTSSARIVKRVIGEFDKLAIHNSVAVNKTRHQLSNPQLENMFNQGQYSGKMHRIISGTSGCTFSGSHLDLSKKVCQASVHDSVAANTTRPSVTREDIF